MNQAELSLMKGMIDILNRHLKEPFLTSEQYSMRLADLKEFEEETGCILSNSPTCKDRVTPLVQIKGVPKYVVFDKCNDIDSIIKFAEQKEMLVSLNITGTNASIIYMDGVMKNFIIDNAIAMIDLDKIDNVPYKINRKENVYIVDGVLHNSKFYVIDVVKNGESLYSNFKEAKELGFTIVPHWLANNFDPKNLKSNIEYIYDYADEEKLNHNGIAFRFNEISYNEGIIYELS